MALSRREGGGLFDGFFEAMPLARMSSSDWPVMKSGLSMDMVEKADSFVAHVDVPGVPKEDVHLSVEEGVLTVSADYKRENVQKADGDRVHWVERSSGHVSRSIKLPDNVDAEAIKASQKDGVLEIIIPKPDAEAKKSHRINID
ncbi:17.9 kDa class I heat shock protein [Hondaea fermentalgiana]|uniref:17.9 kDa class I heat shock protein n=1 Tax=Hondaea fermentalgiana TaxID=2315210 RepID=A0A2R5GB20_9STRA|nr:17.9 kDa class I heat shock protein [Hondaea fermentalgiana]|eukprot:GBG28197.1 17.9 kDa class I heat shock protein [Hondaea fermentalgiana]